MKLIEDIRRGNNPEPAMLLDQLETYFPLLSELEKTPQEPEWHGEGDVRIHTEMVIQEVYKLLDSDGADLSSSERVILVFGAALHDIGKALTTREEIFDGITRIVSPRHAARGFSYVAPRIGALGISYEETLQILGLIAYHHDVRKLVQRDSGKHKYSRLARSVNLKLLYHLETADNLGRICDDMESQIEILELFRLAAEEFDLWDNADPYREWNSIFAAEISKPEVLRYIRDYAIHDFESGLIKSPHEALARRWKHREDYATVTVLCGPSGCGKSTIANSLASHETILLSLDTIREELTGSREDQSQNGQVLQVAKERLKDALRNKCDVIWDSTTLRRDGRSMILDLARDYHAFTRIVAFGIPPETAHKQNRNRNHAIPGSVIDQQYRRLQWPELWEAHVVEYRFDT